jgi:membrane protein YdbS with pleckstrin-like domain
LVLATQKRGSITRRSTRARGEERRVTPPLEPGEEVRLDARPHGVALVRPLVWPLLLAGVGAVLVIIGSGLHWGPALAGAVALAFAFLLSLRAVWRWDRTRLVLTTEKLYVVYGLARRRAAAVRLSRVPALEFEQGLAGRIFGYGTLVAGDFEVPYVPEGHRVRNLLG